MLQRNATVLSLTVACAAVHGQAVELVSGSMRIDPGTTVQFVGPLTFTIQSGAAVVNDGTIDLGSAATLSEPSGGPIVGTGVELATIDLDGPLGNVEPGGLGLTVSTGSPIGPLTITRGHLPRTFPEGDPSIARWFQLDAPLANSGDATFTLRYDATELGPLSADGIGLFGSNAIDGPWTLLASTNYPAAHTIEGTVPAPWGVYSAFDVNAPTPSPSLQATSGLHVWPTLTEDVLFIHATDGTPIGGVALFDGLGRSIDARILHAKGDLVSLDVSHLAQGTYLLHVDGHQAMKIRKV
ncbi:MAG: T9SS type A sorting domain-containing protein [Flavobacteriales bacterium]|jgi:hypothetical protein|nr:T9SS type A sorting domain-containing protein [Flavobacteriales bacterium]